MRRPIRYGKLQAIYTDNVIIREENQVKRRTVLVTFGALLHDIGKIAYRAGEPGTHSSSGYRLLRELFQQQEVLDCVRYHHESALRAAKLAPDALAYAVNLADNISAAADRREEEGEQEGGFDRTLPLESIFNHLNGRNNTLALPPNQTEGVMPEPQEGIHLEQSEYIRLLRELREGLKGIVLEPQYLNSLLALLEGWTSSVPSSTARAERTDISLYDHVKVAAAVGACISEYLEDGGRLDWKRELLDHQREFCKEEAFLLFSADLSGIQSFLYTVTTEQALRSLRSRSFYLELLMEHVIDLLLEGCGLCRTNLLYSGGGHCYLLLPNTENVRQTLESCMNQVRDYLRTEFGTQLYLAAAWAPCSADTLVNRPAQEAPYQALYRRLSLRLAEQKLHRYTAAELRAMNRPEEAPAARECKVCGRSDRVDDEGRCPWCSRFVRMSRPIQEKDVYLVSHRESADALPLPGGLYLSFADEKEAREALRTDPEILRVYTKNRLHTGLSYATRLHVGDYHASNLMEELADQAQGIRRLAVCRADVDNLGATFVSGFEQEGPQRNRYVTLSRTAALSRALSIFFRSYINNILAGDGKVNRALPVSIVYSGGDDVFLVGAWDGLLEGALRIRDAFSRFTGNALSLSAGLTLHTRTYPIRQAALETEELEQEAKSFDGRKDAISLFAARQGFVYHWTDFTSLVLGEKLSCLRTFFDGQSDEEWGRGKAFLYHLLALIRNCEQPINLARFAYLLARMEPGERSLPAHQAAYRDFSKRMYQWYRRPEERQQLITAIYLYVYQTRKQEEIL